MDGRQQVIWVESLSFHQNCNDWSNKDNHEGWKNLALEERDFIRLLSSLQRPKVLDLGCGIGRHAIVFALAHFSVTATDASATSI